LIILNMSYNYDDYDDYKYISSNYKGVYEYIRYPNKDLNKMGYYYIKDIHKCYDKNFKGSVNYYKTMFEREIKHTSQLEKSLSLLKKKENVWDINVKNFGKNYPYTLEYIKDSSNPWDWDSISKSITCQETLKISSEEESKKEPEGTKCVESIKCTKVPKFSKGLCAWYVNPNRDIPCVVQIEKVYTDSPDEIYYDVMFIDTREVKQTIESYLIDMDGGHVSTAFVNMVTKIETFEERQKNIRNLLTDSVVSK